jgi:phospho-N-acetylmuramoyl-pentapeptide-transferase
MLFIIFLHFKMYIFFTSLTKFWAGFNVFNYITFRAAMAFVTSFTFMLWFVPKLIVKLHNIGGRQAIRSFIHSSADNQEKQKTPTMGGIAIMLAIFLSIAMWCNLCNQYVLIIALSGVTFSLVGYADDYQKIAKKGYHGLSPQLRLCLEIIFALGIIFWANAYSGSDFYSSSLLIPCFKNITINGIIFYTIVRVFTIIGTCNAVNLTDGLDGLAIVPVAIVAMCLGVFCYIIGNDHHAAYLLFKTIPNLSEIAIICAAIIGASLGFLWFNAKPAQIFMGDVGSLGLGGVLGTIAIVAKVELILFIAGGLFVMEAVSVILQLASLKIRKKKIFLIAPIHHHFEKKGWQETKIVARFWVIAIICCILALLTLKIR